MKICDLNTILEKHIEYELPNLFIDTSTHSEIFIDTTEKLVLKIDTEVFLKDALSSFLNKSNPHSEITKQFLLDKDRTQHFLIYKNTVYSFKLLNITDKILQGIHTQAIIVPLLEIAYKYVKLKYSDNDIIISQSKKSLQYYHYVDNPNVDELFNYKHDIVITIDMNICKLTKSIGKCRLKIKIPFIATIDDCVVFDDYTKFTILFE